ncbi:RING finger protein 17-like [Leptosomus discolor]
MAIEMVDGEPPYFSEDPLRDRFRAQLPRQLGSTILQYSPPRIPQEREVSVVVSHINSPSDFYLQWKIQEVYRHEHGTNVEMLCPVEGQACVAKWEDGNWYRAQILGLPSHQAVLVKYVDFGNVATLTLKDICRVEKEFLSFPEKIVFVGSACAQILEANILSVELVDSPAPPGRIFSINCQLVKEDLASYITGPFKQVFVKVLHDQTSLGTLLRTVLAPVAVRLYAQGPLERCPESTGVRPNEIWDVPLEIPEASEALNPRDVESMDGGDFKSLSKQELQARISHVVSPSKIFLQWLSSERTLKSLQEKMVKQPLATECSLADIRPAGGSPQWTATACECLSSYLAGARVKVFLQTALNQLMTDIQSNLQCLGLLQPYCWAKGEACVVRGPDAMWYRGRVVGLSSACLQVQYIDHGYMERVIPCLLYPAALYAGVPAFCIPYELHKTVPNPWGKLSVSLCFGGTSLSSFMARQKFCVAEEGTGAALCS